jgi:hypothetical protein
MSDDLEGRLRHSLRSTRLPRAPEGLADYLANLPEAQDLPRRSPVAWWRPILVGGAAFLLLLGIGSLLLIGASRRPSTPAPSVPAGLRHFEAGGIAFDYPADWISQSGLAFQSLYGERLLGLLSRGAPVCQPSSEGSPSSAPGSTPKCQDGTARAQGSMVLRISRDTDPLVTAVPAVGTPISLAGRPTWFLDVPDGDPPFVRWTITAWDGSFYMLTARFPREDNAARHAELAALISSVTLTASGPLIQPTNGRRHLEPLAGVSFDYPADWFLYYPGNDSSADQALVVVSSKQLLPCQSQFCQGYSVGPGTIAVEFRVGGGPSAPDWSLAKERVAGEPAFHQDWNGPNAHDADEGRSWGVRLPGSMRTVLGIAVSLRGPGLPNLNQEFANLLDTVRIVVPPLPSGPPEIVAKEAVKTAIAGLKNSGNLSDGFLGCFPDGPGSRQGTINVGPRGDPLDTRHEATCTATVIATDNGLWQLDLLASWSAPSRGQVGERVWITPDGTITDQSDLPIQ